MTKIITITFLLSFTTVWAEDPLNSNTGSEINRATVSNEDKKAPNGEQKKKKSIQKNEVEQEEESPENKKDKDQGELSP